jgi:hypothetical protein
MPTTMPDLTCEGDQHVFRSHKVRCQCGAWLVAVSMPANVHAREAAFLDRAKQMAVPMLQQTAAPPPSRAHTIGRMIGRGLLILAGAFLTGAVAGAWYTGCRMVIRLAQ